MRKNNMLSKYYFYVWSFFALFSCGVNKNADNASNLNIIGGRPASYYPFFVQLLAGAKSPNGFCGGTLIAPRIVVTAAHCIYSELAKDLYVAMGMGDGGSLHLTKPVKVIGLVKHVDFIGTPEHGNDIALLYLDRYHPEQFLNPIKPAVVDLTGAVADNEMLRTVGLGRLSSLGQVQGTTIQEVDIPVVPKSVCSEVYDITASQLCVGDVVHGGRDSCQGDSGGPLLRMKAGGLAELVGVVSYGHGCGQKKQPGIYTKMAAYTAWIADKSRELALELDPVKPQEVMKPLVSTRCVSQVNGVIQHVETNGTSRDTRWKVDDGSAAYTEVKKKPGGAVLATCEFRDQHAAKVSVSWIRRQPSDKTVIALAELKTGKLYQSTSMPLVYIADSLYCNTSRGPVAFYDTRTQSYVSYNDRIYHFGDATADPANNQTTWGCQSSNMVVEIFELKTSGKLAARVSHPAVGTLVRVLDIATTPPEQILKTWFSRIDNDTLTLHLKNVGKEDLFTWKLECLRDFTLTTKKGPVTALPRPVGSGFYALLTTGQAAEANLAAGGAQELAIQFAASNTAGYGCLINQMFPVVDP